MIIDWTYLCFCLALLIGGALGFAILWVMDKCLTLGSR